METRHALRFPHAFTRCPMTSGSKDKAASLLATVEARRLRGADAEAWRRFGPYLSERQWGTVREDYSANGDAWDYFPHDHARSRAYRWGEDGIAGLRRRRAQLVPLARAVERPATRSSRSASSA